VNTIGQTCLFAFQSICTEFAPHLPVRKSKLVGIFVTWGQILRNFPKTFSKDLPMSDDLRIPKKFSFSEFLMAFFAFTKNFFFSYFPEPV